MSDGSLRTGDVVLAGHVGGTTRCAVVTADGRRLTWHNDYEHAKEARMARERAEAQASGIDPTAEPERRMGIRPDVVLRPGDDVLGAPLARVAHAPGGRMVGRLPRRPHMIAPIRPSSVLGQTSLHPADGRGLPGGGPCDRYALGHGEVWLDSGATLPGACALGTGRKHVCHGSALLAVAYDASNGNLVRHGADADVAPWVAARRKKAEDAGLPEMAGSLVLMAFPALPEAVAELNECLARHGRILGIEKALERLVPPPPLPFIPR